MWTAVPTALLALTLVVVAGLPRKDIRVTRYENRVIADPPSKYGRGPWKYLGYGFGYDYGTDGPKKAFERGYGYIKAMGRDFCQLPPEMCPKEDPRPFVYEGPKQPFYGYHLHHLEPMEKNSIGDQAEKQFVSYYHDDGKTSGQMDPDERVKANMGMITELKNDIDSQAGKEDRTGHAGVVSLGPSNVAIPEIGQKDEKPSIHYPETKDRTSEDDYGSELLAAERSNEDSVAERKPETMYSQPSYRDDSHPSLIISEKRTIAHQNPQSYSNVPASANTAYIPETKILNTFPLLKAGEAIYGKYSYDGTSEGPSFNQPIAPQPVTVLYRKDYPQAQKEYLPSSDTYKKHPEEEQGYRTTYHKSPEGFSADYPAQPKSVSYPASDGLRKDYGPQVRSLQGDSFKKSHPSSEENPSSRVLYSDEDEEVKVPRAHQPKLRLPVVQLGEQPQTSSFYRRRLIADPQFIEY